MKATWLLNEVEVKQFDTYETPPNDFEFNTETKNEVTNKQTKEERIPLSPTKVPDKSKSKVVAYVATKSINKTENIEV